MHVLHISQKPRMQIYGQRIQGQYATYLVTKKGSTIQYTESGVLTDGIHSEWYEQFKPTYAKELKLLASASLKQEENHASLRDGLRAQAVAEAALQSMTENRPIEIEKIW